MNSIHQQYLYLDTHAVGDGSGDGDGDGDGDGSWEGDRMGWGWEGMVMVMVMAMVTEIGMIGKMALCSNACDGCESWRASWSLYCNICDDGAAHVY